MRQRGRQRGEGQMGCLVGLVFLLIAIFVAYKMVPVKVKAAELRRTVVDESKSAGTHNDDRIRKAILKTATDEKLPVTEDNIKIARSSSEIDVTVEYVVPVVFPGYTYQWKFRHYTTNPIF